MILQARLRCVSRNNVCKEIPIDRRAALVSKLSLSRWLAGWRFHVKPCSPTNSLSKGVSSSRLQTQPSGSHKTCY